MLQIKKILFPTSCSENSQNALKYTLAMAEYFGASVEILHVVEPKVDFLVPSVMRYSLLQEQKRNAERMLSEWLKSSKDCKVPIHQEVTLGLAKEMIPIYANNRKDIDLIAIGTNDSQSLSKIFWGSIISQIISSANIPALVIPRGIEFQDILNMAYIAPDVRNWHAVYPQVKKLTDSLGAKLYIAHLAQAKFGEIEGEEHVVLDDYARALHTFAYNTNLHLLVTMATASSMRSTLERMFRYTKAQKMALKATIPLLVLKERT